jgi:hypothetical protein
MLLQVLLLYVYINVYKRKFYIVGRAGGLDLITNLQQTPNISLTGASPPFLPMKAPKNNFVQPSLN